MSELQVKGRIFSKDSFGLLEDLLMDLLVDLLEDPLGHLLEDLLVDLLQLVQGDFERERFAFLLARGHLDLRDQQVV